MLKDAWKGLGLHGDLLVPVIAGEQLPEAEPDQVGDTHPLHDRAASLTAMSLNPSCANLAPFNRQLVSQSAFRLVSFFVLLAAVTRSPPSQ